MNNHSKFNFGRDNSRYKKPLIYAFIIIAVVIAVLSAVYAYQYIKANIDSKKNNLDKENQEERGINIDIDSSYDSDKKYIDLSEFEDAPLKSIKEISSYKRTIRIIQTYKENSYHEQLTVIRSENKLLAENSSRKIIKNGESLFIDFGHEKTMNSADENEFFKNSGLTSLEMLREMCDNTEVYDCVTTLSNDKRILTVQVIDSEREMRMMFLVNVEYGIVVTEQFYYRNIPYRSVITEKLEPSIKVNDSIFEIPLE